MPVADGGAPLAAPRSDAGPGVTTGKNGACPAPNPTTTLWEKPLANVYVDKLDIAGTGEVLFVETTPPLFDGVLHKLSPDGAVVTDLFKAQKLQQLHHGIAVDGADVYFLMTDEKDPIDPTTRVYRVPLAGGEPVAVTPVGRGPNGTSIDAQDATNLYVASDVNVERIIKSTGEKTKLLDETKLSSNEKIRGVQLYDGKIWFEGTVAPAARSVPADGTSSTPTALAQSDCGAYPSLSVSAAGVVCDGVHVSFSGQVKEADDLGRVSPERAGVVFTNELEQNTSLIAEVDLATYMRRPIACGYASNIGNVRASKTHVYWYEDKNQRIFIKSAPR